MSKKPFIDTAEKTDETRQEEWREIERLVEIFQNQFQEGASEDTIENGKKAAGELIGRFYPLFKKYSVLLKTGNIDFDDKEQKMFVATFIDDDALKRALKRQKQKAEYRDQIYRKFGFVKETYGTLPEDEIITDLHTILLKLAKRYKQQGKSFCGYLFNVFRYEVMRHIRDFTENPINISYKNVGYEDYMKTTHETAIEEDCFEDSRYENNVGIPDCDWISGKSCSDIFQCLTPIERKLLIKYYMEDWNDRQIADNLGIHINTVNQKRRQAVAKIADYLGIPESAIVRNRKSGKKAIIPI